MIATTPNIHIQPAFHPSMPYPCMFHPPKPYPRKGSPPELLFENTEHCQTHFF